MTNVFEAVAARVRQSRIVIWVCAVSVMAFVLGAIFWVEDTASSYFGIEALVQLFGIQPGVFSITYFAMSVAPQVGLIVFSWLFLSDVRRYVWAGLFALVWFVLDAVSDIYFRSNYGIDGLPDLLVSSAITIIYFTVGSELFITVGLGLFMETLGPALTQYRQLLVEWRRAWASATTAPPSGPPPRRAADSDSQRLRPFNQGRPGIGN